MGLSEWAVFWHCITRFGTALICHVGMAVIRYGKINERFNALLEIVRKRVLVELSQSRDMAEARFVRRDVRMMKALSIKRGSSFYYDKPIFLTIVHIVLDSLRTCCL